MKLSLEQFLRTNNFNTFTISKFETTVQLRNERLPYVELEPVNFSLKRVMSPFDAIIEKDGMKYRAYIHNVTKLESEKLPMVFGLGSNNCIDHALLELVKTQQLDKYYYTDGSITVLELLRYFIGKLYRDRQHDKSQAIGHLLVNEYNRLSEASNNKLYVNYTINDGQESNEPYKLKLNSKDYFNDELTIGIDFTIDEPIQSKDDGWIYPIHILTKKGNDVMARLSAKDTQSFLEKTIESINGLVSGGNNKRN